MIFVLKVNITVIFNHEQLTKNYYCNFIIVVSIIIQTTVTLSVIPSAYLALSAS